MQRIKCQQLSLGIPFLVCWGGMEGVVVKPLRKEGIAGRHEGRCCVCSLPSLLPVFDRKKQKDVGRCSSRDEADVSARRARAASDAVAAPFPPRGSVLFLSASPPLSVPACLPPPPPPNCLTAKASCQPMPFLHVSFLLLLPPNSSCQFSSSLKRPMPGPPLRSDEIYVSVKILLLLL